MKWISVKDKLPDKECIAIGYQNAMIIGYVYVNPYGLVFCESDDQVLPRVTHWMPLPDPPDNKTEE